jgi:hypothetical protein
MSTDLFVGACRCIGGAGRFSSPKNRLTPVELALAERHRLPYWQKATSSTVEIVPGGTAGGTPSLASPLQSLMITIMRVGRVAIMVALGLLTARGAAAAASPPSSSGRPAEKRDVRHDASPTGSDEGRPINVCRKLPAGKRIVKLNLKPETNVADLVGWIASITCKPFIVPSTIGAESKKVTIVSPELITPEEAYRLFVNALDSVGLTVYQTGKFERVIETPRVKTVPLPFCVIDADSYDCVREPSS